MTPVSPQLLRSSLISVKPRQASYLLALRMRSVDSEINGEALEEGALQW